jgi:hypothetical protein
MAKTIKEERLRWVIPIIEKKVKLTESAKVFPYGKRTLERCVSDYKRVKGTVLFSGQAISFPLCFH